MLNYHQPISFSTEAPPQLIIVIDTEEEFNWTAPPDKSATAVTAMEKIHRVQDIFDEYGIKPCYVIDYPIASQAVGYEPLLQIFNKGNCEIGAHLHPWVNPPNEEHLTISNMYPGNLSPDLEYSKLKVLQQQIQKIFGFLPEIYKAGRSGVGKNTTEVLEKLGFTIDLSICASYDFSADGGPNFSDFTTNPFWFGKNNQILEIPTTSTFVGITGKHSKNIYNLAEHFELLKAKAILSRLGIVDRLMLSPEGYTSKEHIRLTQFLFNQGCRTFIWNFHSPSIVHGMTEYTTNRQKLSNFLDSFCYFFDFFFGNFGGVASTPTQLRNQLVENKA